jgi:omega-6 fatty acid desaturase (delta-12 desaturase)
MNQNLPVSGTDKAGVIHSDWYRELSRFEKPDLLKASGQLLNTLVPYVALWILMVFMLKKGLSFWYVLPLVVLASGMLARIFIFFHDCCHGSFFRSRLANRILGYVSGVLTFTPYEDWGRTHARHHATAGDLDRRGTGDVWTMTVDEYLAAPKLERLWYRIFRNPFVLLILGPIFVFIILQRLPHKGVGRRERLSVWITNLAIAAVVITLCLTIGWKTYLLIQGPIAMIAFASGIWLFYVQHQFEEEYWARHADWDPIRASLEGSSYYKLPKVLQWFTGNIGLHHIHHLRPGIPNYNLQKCLDEVPVLQTVKPLTFWRSLRALWLHLWDETDQKLVSFRSLKRRRPLRT